MFVCVCMYVRVCMCHIGISVCLNGFAEDRTNACTELFGAGAHTEPRRCASRGRACTASRCRLKGSNHCFLYVVAHHTLRILVTTADYSEKHMLLCSTFFSEFLKQTLVFIHLTTV